MRLFILLLCFSSTIAQENCTTEVSKTAKKHYTKAKRYIQDYNYSKSIESLNNAIDEQVNFSDAYYLLASIYEKKGKDIEAAKNFEKTIEYCPMYSPNVYWSLADISFKNKSYQKAVLY